MHKIVKFLCLIIFLCFSFNFNRLFVKADTVENKNINQKLEYFLRSNNINGLILVRDRNNEYSIIRNTIPNISSQSEVLQNRYFPIASLQKIMTGILIEKLVNEGTLNWNTRLDKFFPDIPNSRNIKLWQLMSHQSGVYDEEKIPKIPLNSETDRMNYVMKNFGVKGNHNWHYASSNYGILAAILRAQEKNTYNNILKEKIFRPYNLHNIKPEEKLNADQVILPIELYSKKAILFKRLLLSVTSLTNLGVLFGNYISNDLSWLSLKNCLSESFGAGDYLATPESYWKLISNTLLYNPRIYNNLKNNSLKTQAGYFGGCYFRGRYFYASGNIGNYNCCCFAADYKTKRMIMFFTNNMNYLSLKKIQEQLYSKYFSENVYKSKNS